MNWDVLSAWGDLETDRVESNAAVYGNLLNQCPVARLQIDKTVSYWGVFAFEDLAKVAADTRTFSNVTPLAGPRIVPLQSDPPEHTGYRRLLNPFFSVERIAKTKAETLPIVTGMLDALIAQGFVDFAQQFAYPFPTRVLCKFLRIPDTDWPLHHEFVTKLEELSGHGLSAPKESIGTFAQGFMPYLLNFISTRRDRPGDDVVSGILNAEVQGHKLDEIEVAFMVMTLMMAGHITTTSAVGNLVLRLARDSALQTFLRENPNRIGDAVEESLRIDTPQQAMPRRCTKDAQVGGQSIKAGEYLLLNFGSANVDPKHWSDPEKFDLDRVDKRHVGFGRGIHGCLGQSLARMEIRIAVEELLARTHSFELSGSVHRRAWPRMSVEKMPIRLVPSRSA